MQEQLNTEEPTTRAEGAGGRPTRRRRSLRWLLALVALCALGGSGFAVSGRDAGAATPTCRNVTRSFDVGVQKYIMAPGWGWTAWRVRPNIYIHDTCGGGSITVFPNVYDAAVKAKGGELRISSVSYRTNRDSSWVPLSRSQTWPSVAYKGVIACGQSGYRVTQVRIVTAVWARADAGGMVGLSSSTNVFDVG